MSYRRIITAALAETKSQFKLAEALATDIPAKRRGPTPAKEQSVTEHLEAAQAAIIDAGGEPRSIATLSDHRLTGIWAADPDGGFGWLPGTSYTAHNLARGTGLSLEQFTELPEAERSIDALRNWNAQPANSPLATRNQANNVPHEPADEERIPGPKFLPANGDHADEAEVPSWDALAEMLTTFTRRLTVMLDHLTRAPSARVRAQLLTDTEAAEMLLAGLHERLASRKRASA